MPGPEPDRAPPPDRRWGWGWRIGALGAVVVVAAVIGWATLQPASTDQGGLAPAISAPAVGGGAYSLRAQRGHWVLVNFFASWCEPCRVELPQLRALDRRHPAGLRVVSIDYLDDSLPRAAALIHTAGGTWPLLDDPSAIAGYGVDQGLPESFLIDPAGRLSGRIFGGVRAAQVTATVTGRAT